MSIKIFSGTGYEKLTNEIAKQLSVEVGNIRIDKFSDRLSN